MLDCVCLGFKKESDGKSYQNQVKLDDREQ